MICWQHQNIDAIGNLIVGEDTTVPQNGSEDRYDLIYVFDRVGGEWPIRQLFHERLVAS